MTKQITASQTSRQPWRPRASSRQWIVQPNRS